MFSSEIFSRKVNKRLKMVPIRATGLIAFIVVKAFVISDYRLLKVEKKKKRKEMITFWFNTTVTVFIFVKAMLKCCGLVKTVAGRLRPKGQALCKLMNRKYIKFGQKGCRSKS